MELATRRAEDATAQLEARASALDGLIAAGALPDVTGLPSDEEIQAQLDAVTTRAAVEAELARIKDELASAGGQPPARAARGSRGRPRS